MTTVEEIKTAITHLSDADLCELRAWYEQFDAERWDAQMVADVAAGRLDDLAAEAIQSFHNGTTTEL
jgi:hypothetical protein